MEDPSKGTTEVVGCERPRWPDIWAQKGSILELVIVLILFISSLADGDFKLIVILSIVVTILACFLILYDMYDMRKRRDFRKVVVALLLLDCVVLIASVVVLHYWRMMVDNEIGEEILDTLYGLDALMLACMIVIVSGRLYVRIRDRRIAEAENGILMRDTNGRTPGQMV